LTQEHPAEEEEGSRAGEHMKREVALHSRHGLPNAVMHDVEHVDADSEAGASPAGAQAVTRPCFARRGGMAYFQEELLEPCVDDGGTPNGAIRREGPIDITRALPGRGGVVPSLKKAENKAERVVASEARPVNGAGNVPRKSLTLNIDCDAANVESDVAPEKKHARVGAVVPAVAQDQASTPAQGVVVVGGETQAKDVEHNLGWDRHAGGARTFSVALGSFEGAPTSSGQPKIVPKSWAIVATIFMRLVNGRHVRVERALGHESFSAEVRNVEQDSARLGRERGASGLAVKLRQRDRAKIHKALPLTTVTGLRACPSAVSQQFSCVSG
jgi:hypothetical protein